MENPWKLATIGMALVVVTALVTGLTTAYVLRTESTAEAQSPVLAPVKPAVRAIPATTAPRRPAPTVSRPTPAPVVVAPAPMPRVEPVAAPAATASAPADCATGGERAVRVAKPGLLGGLIGAGVGAAGGAIADGGKGAGKGAAIGALAGAALGTGYGALKTRRECGTVFGGSAVSAPAVSPSDPTAVPGGVQSVQAPFAVSDDRITVYPVR